MERYLIYKATLEAIADAIREKTGNPSKLYPENMPGRIRSIKTTTSDSTIGVDPVVVAEAERVVNSMLPKIASNSLTFVAMSDMHEIGDGESQYSYVIARIRNGNMHAGQAAKIISDKVGLDFFANLGDFIYGSSATTTAQGIQCFVNVRKYIQDVVESNESFLTVGNHDSMQYSSSVIGGSPIPYSILSDIIGTYRYKDYESKKVRVICLNTADNSVTTTMKEGLSGAQLQWFADALDLSAKSDPSQWGIIILSHHPLDWGEVKVAANCLATYLEGGTYSVTHGGVSVSKNFSGKNSAKIIAQFHGHVHGFRVDYINDLRTGSPVPTTVKRVAIPNACFERVNEYGENSGFDSNNIEFGETTSYEKKEGDFSKDTSFCLVSIDLDNEVIYADCYGAGYDRIISYASGDIITYSITTTLSNASTNNSTSSIIEGSNYSAVITPDSGYQVDNITVTMGGTDITSTAVNGSIISISNITGDIVITVTTVESSDFVYGDFTNLVPTATTAHGGTEIYNGVGYKNDTYISSGDVYKDHTGTVAVGYLKFSPTDVIYIKGATLSTDSYVRIYTETMSGSAMYYCEGTNLSNGTWGNSNYPIVFYVETLGTDYYKLTPNTDVINQDLYYRVSLLGTGENLIITHNEQIHADALSYINLVKTSESYDSTDVYNSGLGYKNGTYVSESNNGDGTDSACVATGWIPYTYNPNNVLYVKGATIDTSNSHVRVYGYSTKTNVDGAHGYGAGSNLTTHYTLETLGDQYYKLTPVTTSTLIQYVRFSLIGTGENLVVTINEPIE